MNEFGFTTKTIDELLPYDFSKLGYLNIQDTVALYSENQNKTYKVTLQDIQRVVDTKMDCLPATQVNPGLMSAEDKTKLDNIQDYVHFETVENLVDGFTTGSLRTIGSTEELTGEYELGTNAFAEGLLTQASGNSSHAEGDSSIASGVASHAEGQLTQATGLNAHTLGQETVANNTNTHALGLETQASGAAAHAEGQETISSHTATHALGFATKATNGYAHAEGNSTTASGFSSHAEGNFTTASGVNAHAEGDTVIASGISSHAEGNNTEAAGTASHALGTGTSAQTKSQTVLGEYNVLDSIGTTNTRGKYACIVGNGTATLRSNALTISWDGNVDIAGTPSANTHLVRKQDLDESFSKINFKVKIGDGSEEVTTERNLFTEHTLLDLLYPVGSVYISTNLVNPKAIFGGIWQKIEGKFLIGAGTRIGLDNVSRTFNLGDENGYYNGSVISHSHYLSLRSTTEGAHSHSMNNIWSNGSGSKDAYKMTSSRKLTTRSTASAGAHAHTVSGNTNASGVAAQDRNMPPYLAVNIWERIL